MVEIKLTIDEQGMATVEAMQDGQPLGEPEEFQSPAEAISAIGQMVGTDEGMEEEGAESAMAQATEGAAGMEEPMGEAGMTKSMWNEEAKKRKPMM